MCEIYGISSNAKVKINNDLKTFFSHSCKHCHGWGLALNGKEHTVVKEGIAAYKSNLLKKILNKDITEKLAIAHIRYATSGEVSKRNAHPFVGKDMLGNTWTLVHNGTATKGKLVEKYKKYAKGETDSEIILIYLINRINRGIILNNSKELSVKQKGDILQRAIKDITLENRINLLFTDGDNLYVHCNLKESLYSKRTNNSIKFATEPLNKSKDKWNPVKINTLFIYKDSKLIYKGKAHKNEYFKPENNDNNEGKLQIVGA